MISVFRSFLSFIGHVGFHVFPALGFVPLIVTSGLGFSVPLAAPASPSMTLLGNNGLAPITNNRYPIIILRGLCVFIDFVVGVQCLQGAGTNNR